MARRRATPGGWHITSRVVAALIPGYLLTNTASIALGMLYPGSKLSGVAAVSVASFALWTAIVCWVFAVERLRTVWLGLLGAIALTAIAPVYLFLTGAGG
ncbi:MAG: hypothetical protein AAF610_15395 [Pseudomonadota bacterium]